jgi:hypothetical protein
MTEFVTEKVAHTLWLFSNPVMFVGIDAFSALSCPVSSLFIFSQSSLVPFRRHVENTALFYGA